MTDISSVMNRVTKGDCVQLLNQLPEGSVDLIFADPPFNIGYEYDVYRDNKEKQDYLDWSRQWITGVYRALKESGTFWLAIGDEYAAELKLLSQEIGFHPRSWVVWYYTFGVNCKFKFTRSHAHLFYFTKHPTEFTFRSEELENRIPSARQLVYNDNRANPFGRLPDDTWVLRPQDLADCFTTAEDTWYIPRVAGTFKERAGFHGCQMPEQLLGRIIRCCSHEGELVLDPFSGSATTVAVAKKLGRNHLGFDLSPEYVERGNARLESTRVGDPLDGAAEPTMSAPATPNRDQSSGKAKRGKQPKAAESEPTAKIAPKEIQLFESRITEVFRAICDGYSLDRVVADPEFNQPFVDLCRQLGLPGDARTWNHSLFRMRKAGRWDVPTTKRTEISWEDCDQFLFASEIALQQMLDREFESLDEILCDPVAVEQFDAEAKRLAPGFSSFQYRWGALKLRKEAKVARTRAGVLKAGRLACETSLNNSCWKSLPDAAGVYLIRSVKGQSPIYAGEAMNLQNRFKMQFAAKQLGWWEDVAQGKLQFGFFTTEGEVGELLAYQSLLVKSHRPKLNFHELAAA